MSMRGPKSKTYDGTNREVAAKSIGGVGMITAAYGVQEAFPGSDATGAFLLLSFIVILWAFPWMLEAIDRVLMWKNTRGYHADE